jgi:hypothetical protein
MAFKKSVCRLFARISSVSTVMVKHVVSVFSRTWVSVSWVGILMVGCRSLRCALLCFLPGNFFIFGCYSSSEDRVHLWSGRQNQRCCVHNRFYRYMNTQVQMLSITKTPFDYGISSSVLFMRLEKKQQRKESGTIFPSPAARSNSHP